MMEIPCRILSRPNAREYCTTCSRHAGMPPVCTLNRADPGYLEKEPGEKRKRYTKKKPIRGIGGKVSKMRQRTINTLIEKGKASSFVAYYPIDEAIKRAGI